MWVGFQSRRNCSSDISFDLKMEERVNQFACTGWNRDDTRNEMLKAKQMNRRELLFGDKVKRRKNISALATKWDPRIPPKGKIIHQFKNILYSDAVCKTISLEGSIIPSNRRLRNIGEILKPTIPNRFPQNGPPLEQFF